MSKAAFHRLLYEQLFRDSESADHRTQLCCARALGVHIHDKLAIHQSDYGYCCHAATVSVVDKLLQGLFHLSLSLPWVLHISSDYPRPFANVNGTKGREGGHSAAYCFDTFVVLRYAAATHTSRHVTLCYGRACKCQPGSRLSRRAAVAVLHRHRSGGYPYRLGCHAMVHGKVGIQTRHQLGHRHAITANLTAQYVQPFQSVGLGPLLQLADQVGTRQ